MATTGETIPEWAMAEADNLTPFPDGEWAVRDLKPIARALAAAYARGREDERLLPLGLAPVPPAGEYLCRACGNFHRTDQPIPNDERHL